MLTNNFERGWGCISTQSYAVYANVHIANYKIKLKKLNRNIFVTCENFDKYKEVEK